MRKFRVVGWVLVAMLGSAATGSVMGDAVPMGSLTTLGSALGDFLSTTAGRAEPDLIRFEIGADDPTESDGTGNEVAGVTVTTLGDNRASAFEPDLTEGEAGAGSSESPVGDEGQATDGGGTGAGSDDGGTSGDGPSGGGSGGSTGGSTTTTTTAATTTTTTTPATTTTTVATDTNFDSTAESQFVTKINQLRKSEGLTALSRSGSLDAEARAWAKYMGENGKLAHSDLSRLIPPWRSVGENVAMGSSVEVIFNNLAGDAHHRDIMLGDFTHVGVGVWVDANGTLWTAHLFAR